MLAAAMILCWQLRDLSLKNMLLNSTSLSPSNCSIQLTSGHASYKKEWWFIQNLSFTSSTSTNGTNKNLMIFIMILLSKNLLFLTKPLLKNPMLTIWSKTIRSNSNLLIKVPVIYVAKRTSPFIKTLSVNIFTVKHAGRILSKKTSIITEFFSIVCTLNAINTLYSRY